MPITFTDRTAGSSKMTGSIAREALSRVLFWRLGELSSRVRKTARAGKDGKTRVSA